MPLYDYRCRACGHVFSALVFSGQTSEEEIECPKCHENDAEKLLSMKTAVLSSGKSTSSSAGCTAPAGSGFS